MNDGQWEFDFETDESAMVQRLNPAMRCVSTASDAHFRSLSILIAYYGT